MPQISPVSSFYKIHRVDRLNVACTFHICKWEIFAVLYNNGKWERLDLIASTETLLSEEGPRDLCKTPLNTQAPRAVGRFWSREPEKHCS